MIGTFTFTLANSEFVREFLPVPAHHSLSNSPTNIPLGLNLDRLVGQLSEFSSCLTKFSSPDRGLPDAPSITKCAELILKALLHSSVFRANPDAFPVPNPVIDFVNNPKVGKPVVVQPIIVGSKGKEKNPKVKQIIKIIEKPAPGFNPGVSSQALAHALANSASLPSGSLPLIIPVEDSPTLLIANALEKRHLGVRNPPVTSTTLQESSSSPSSSSSSSSPSESTTPSSPLISKRKTGLVPPYVQFF